MLTARPPGWRLQAALLAWCCIVSLTGAVHSAGATSIEPFRPLASDTVQLHVTLPGFAPNTIDQIGLVIDGTTIDVHARVTSGTFGQIVEARSDLVLGRLAAQTYTVRVLLRERHLIDGDYGDEYVQTSFAFTVVDVRNGYHSLSIRPARPDSTDRITFVGTYPNPGRQFDGATAKVTGTSIAITYRQTGSIGFLPSEDSFSVTIDPLPPGEYTARLFGQVRNEAGEPYTTPVPVTEPVTFSVTAGSTIQRVAKEFFHAGLGHYFLTADELEIRSLVESPEQGWAPTNNTFPVYDRDRAPAGAVPVCRFYGSISPGPNSHFYTGDAAECAALKTIALNTAPLDPRWNFETIAFAAFVAIGSSCPSAAPAPVYRLFNNRAQLRDPNHRFVASLVLYEQMAMSGWRGEGIAFCTALESP